MHIWEKEHSRKNEQYAQRPWGRTSKEACMVKIELVGEGWVETSRWLQLDSEWKGTLCEEFEQRDDLLQHNIARGFWLVGWAKAAGARAEGGGQSVAITIIWARDNGEPDQVMAAGVTWGPASGFIQRVEPTEMLKRQKLGMREEGY